MLSTNPFLLIILLRVTPSANRNTYSVATLIIHIPRVEALRTSTLGWGIATPSELLLLGEAHPHALPKGRELHFAVFKVVVWCSFPLGKVGMGLWMGLVFLLLPPCRIGRSPEKLQIFLCYSPFVFYPARQ